MRMYLAEGSSVTTANASGQIKNATDAHTTRTNFGTAPTVMMAVMRPRGYVVRTVKMSLIMEKMEDFCAQTVDASWHFQDAMEGRTVKMGAMRPPSYVGSTARM